MKTATWTSLHKAATLLFCSFALGILANTASAALTYVDATDEGGDTALSAGGALVANDTTGDTTWRQRDNAAFGADESVFEGVEPSPEIVTTLSGLTPGLAYELNVHFWDPVSVAEDWNVSAGFTSGDLTLFSREGDSELAGSTASVLANTLDYDTAPSVFGPFSGREMLAGALGLATADGNGEIAVYIDDFGSGDVNVRTWYDGVSYQAIPEPSSLLIAGLALAGVAAARRKS